MLTYLAFALDKGTDRNSYMARWIPQRGILANTFDRHDFSMKWSYGEFDAAEKHAARGVLNNRADCEAGIAKLSFNTTGRLIR